MANVFATLPVPVGNGTGAALDASSFGALKTFVVDVGTANVDTLTTLEMSVDAGATVWTALTTIQGSGTFSCENAAHWLRCTVANVKPGFGSVDVEVGSTDDGSTFQAVVATATNGTGAAVDISGQTGLLKTVQVGGVFQGTVIIEFSEDGAHWGEFESFQAPEAMTGLVVAAWARVVRNSVPVLNPGVPTVTIGFTSPPGGGGGGGTGNPQMVAYTATGGETTFTVTLPAARLTAAYGVVATVGDCAVQFVVNVPNVSRTTVNFSATASLPLTAGDTVDFFISDKS